MFKYFYYFLYNVFGITTNVVYVVDPSSTKASSLKTPEQQFKHGPSVIKERFSRNSQNQNNLGAVVNIESSTGTRYCVWVSIEKTTDGQPRTDLLMFHWLDESHVLTYYKQHARHDTWREHFFGLRSHVNQISQTHAACAASSIETDLYNHCTEQIRQFLA